MNSRRYVVVLLALLAACSAPREPEVSDGAPPRTIAPERVSDAIPRADPILDAGNRSPYTVDGRRYEILESASGYREQGIASWYGTKFHGQKTSNGEIFDLYRATAAHRTLPIPCYVRVTNQVNGRSIVVRVNDRGPFHSDRIIDLSYGAAVKLGYMEQGTAPVLVEALDVAGVDDRRGTELGSYRYLQLGAFGTESAAEGLRKELVSRVAAPVFISPVESSGAILYRVRIGPLEKPGQLAELQEQLRNQGFGEGQPLP